MEKKHYIKSECDVYNMYEKIQQAMQRKVAKYGICIETNPSSNFKISTLDTYEEHPITKFYNMGLTWNEELLDKCPQIHSSINTDDKGLFDTSLENEYALIGRSLEKKIIINSMCMNGSIG